jgi:hypothetical protein
LALGFSAPAEPRRLWKPGDVDLGCIHLGKDITVGRESGSKPSSQALCTIRRPIAAGLSAIALGLSDAATADVVRHSDVPTALQGTWAAKPEECQKDDKIVLSANTYESADTICTVDWVSETAGPRGPRYSAHMQCSKGRNSQKQIVDTIFLPTDADHISLGSTFGSLRSLQRCADTR